MEHREAMSLIVSEFTHCSLPIFSESRRCGWFDRIHSIFLFHAVSTYTNSSFRGAFFGFFLFSVVCKYIAPLLTEIDHCIPSLDLARPVAENIYYQFL